MYRILDYLLYPLMYVLQGNLTDSPQETHPWHVKKHRWKSKGVLIKGDDVNSKFGQSGISKYLGLYHMPIFGGLKKYIVIENKKFKKYWNVGWNNEMQILKIYDSKVKLLPGKESYYIHALSDGSKEVSVKVVDSGRIGDGRYKSVRLF